MVRHRLTDNEWQAIQDLFPKPARTGRPPTEARAVVDGILWILRTGAPWRDLPEEFPPWKTVWHLFDKWNHEGLLDALLKQLRAVQVDIGNIDEELWCVDGTIIRAARCAAGGGKKGIPTSRPTTRLAAPAAVFPRKSTCSVIATAILSTSTSPRGRSTSPKP